MPIFTYARQGTLIHFTVIRTWLPLAPLHLAGDGIGLAYDRSSDTLKGHRDQARLANRVISPFIDANHTLAFGAAYNEFRTDDSLESDRDDDSGPEDQTTALDDEDTKAEKKDALRKKRAR